jgi:hypothetical protein
MNVSAPERAMQWCQNQQKQNRGTVRVRNQVAADPVTIYLWYHKRNVGLRSEGRRVIDNQYAGSSELRRQFSSDQTCRGEEHNVASTQFVTIHDKDSIMPAVKCHFSRPGRK